MGELYAFSYILLILCVKSFERDSQEMVLIGTDQQVTSGKVYSEEVSENYFC